MGTQDYYQLLGVSRYASEDALKRAYHARLLQFHPDRNPGNELALSRTREIIEAYKTLSDPASRSSYDRAITVAAAPVFVPVHRETSPVPDWMVRAAMNIVALFVMVCLVLAGVQALTADGGPAFRPDSMQFDSAPARPLPALADPGVSDTDAWYAATQYRLGSANDWVTRKLVQAYSDAAERAETSGDFTRARFFRDGIRQVEAARRERFL